AARRAPARPSPSTCRRARSRSRSCSGRRWRACRRTRRGSWGRGSWSCRSRTRSSRSSDLTRRTGPGRTPPGVLSFAGLRAVAPVAAVRVGDEGALVAGDGPRHHHRERALSLGGPAVVRGGARPVDGDDPRLGDGRAVAAWAGGRGADGEGVAGEGDAVRAGERGDAAVAGAGQLERPGPALAQAHRRGGE